MVLKYAKVVDNNTGLCKVLAQKSPYYTEQDVTLSVLDGNWYLTYILENDRSYQLKVLEKMQKEKYQEITLAYDNACNYGVTPVKLGKKTYYANRSWLGTWNEVLVGLEYSGENAFVRLYEKVKDYYKNATIQDVTLEQYKKLYMQLITYRFSTLQPLRNELYTKLIACQTADDVNAITYDFGDTINEQLGSDKLILQ